jgi:hypothetical protein
MLLVVGAVVARGNRFPTEKDVDDAFAAYAKGSYEVQRYEPLARLMDRLHYPKTREQGGAFGHAAHRLQETYLETHDVVIAMVIIRGLNRDVCCEVQNGLCEVYENLLHDAEFFDYFRGSAEAQMALRVCVGSNFSSEEVEALISGDIGSMEEFTERFRPAKPMAEAPLPE